MVLPATPWLFSCKCMVNVPSCNAKISVGKLGCPVKGGDLQLCSSRSNLGSPQIAWFFVVKSLTVSLDYTELYILWQGINRNLTLSRILAMGLAMQYKENSKKRTTGTNLSPSHMADFVRKFLGHPKNKGLQNICCL
jgi:hypothetical protein